MNKCTLCNTNSTLLFPLKVLEGPVIKYCFSCEIAFTDPPPILPEYEIMDFHLNTKEDEKFHHILTEVNDLSADWKELIEIQISLITKYIPPKENILEIGCGEGILLGQLKTKSYNLTGIEPSNNAAKRAKTRGLEIVQGSFPSVELNKSFNLVVMSQVFEHIKDLVPFIKEIKKIIPSGYLMLTQTNYKGLIPLVKKEKWYAWVPDQHYWHFTLNGLTKLLLKHNFEMIDYKYSSLVHPHNLLYKLAKLKSNWQDQFTVLYKLREE